LSGLGGGRVLPDRTGLSNHELSAGSHDDDCEWRRGYDRGACRRGGGYDGIVREWLVYVWE
jgi:hypothetical protein